MDGGGCIARSKVAGGIGFSHGMLEVDSEVNAKFIPHVNLVSEGRAVLEKEGCAEVSGMP